MRNYLLLMLLTFMIIGCENSRNKSSKISSQSIEEIIKQESEFYREYWKKNQNRRTENEFFPCSLSSYSDRHRVIIDATNSSYFYDEFAKCGISGNGYAWEGIITQLLENKNPSLLLKVIFDSEADNFVAFLETKEDQLELTDLIQSVTKEKASFHEFLKSISKKRIDD